MRIIMRPLQINVRMIYPPESKHTDWHKYISLASGCLLAISESLPFLDNINGNGLSSVLKKIHEHAK